MVSGERGGGTRYEIVGIGFGPANLALAIAVEEHNATMPNQPVEAVFLERQPDFAWHRGMLIDGTVMQVSFLKDLATMRNPTSDFGFVSYLHEKGRLADFINHKILFPTRVEFHDYLSWAAAGVRQLVRYGTEVVTLRPVPGGHALLDVVCADGETFRAGNVVLATGLTPTLPDGVALSDRVWHSSQLLHRVGELAGTAPERLVVVGAGQSAAEVTEYLHRTFPAAEVCSVFTRYGYSPADDSPYANRIFDPEAVGEFFGASGPVKERLLRYHRNTNYSVVDLDLIQDLYRKAYQEKVRGEHRLRMINASRVTGVTVEGDRVGVDVHHLLDGSMTRLAADAVVFATGYAPADVSAVLGPLDQHCLRDADGLLAVDRDYRVRTGDELAAGIYLQGGTEHSHGISSSLLSNVAVRAGEILAAILAGRSGMTLPRAA